jgi:hypothetical protein
MTQSKPLPAALMMDVWVSMAPEEREESIRKWMKECAEWEEIDKDQNGEDCGVKDGQDEGGA